MWDYYENVKTIVLKILSKSQKNIVRKCIQIKDLIYSGVYSEPSRASKMKLFTKSAAKSSVLNIRLGSEYASAVESQMYDM